MKHDLTRVSINWGLTSFDIPSVNDAMERFSDIPEPEFSQFDAAAVAGIPVRTLDALDNIPSVEVLNEFCRVLRCDPPIVAGPVDGKFAVLNAAASARALNGGAGREGEVFNALKVADVLAVFATMIEAVEYMTRLPEAQQTRRQSLEERAVLLASSGARRIQLARGLKRYLETATSSAPLTL